ncbi:putative GATA transcription factor 26-like [Capsicum annuum]|nr:putative GATA transcription factor 26-like [Capsicum annuum]KAF3649305.1 putative GATA transcription factor 26-like [Capsicum annuum]
MMGVSSAENSADVPDQVESVMSRINNLALSANRVVPPSNSTESSAMGDSVQDIDKKIRALKKKAKISSLESFHRHLDSAVFFMSLPMQRQLYNNQQEPDFEDIVVDETVTLIYAPNKYICPNEIGLGAMLLVSPTTTTERSASPSPKIDNNASFSTSVPIEKPLVSQTTTPESSVSISKRPLVSPTTTTELSTSLSPMEEDNVYFSMNVPAEKPLVSPTTTTERSASPSPVAEDNATHSMNGPVENSNLQVKFEIYKFSTGTFIEQVALSSAIGNGVIEHSVIVVSEMSGLSTGTFIEK